MSDRENKQQERRAPLSPQGGCPPICCYSPYHLSDFLEVSKSQALSPDIFIQFTNSFKRIVQNQNEQSENEQSLDIMGNRIEQFRVNFEPEEELSHPLPIVEDDKENDLPSSYLATPLKIRKKQLRSPLQDITPSMTQKKRRTGGKQPFSQKVGLFTPRTMEKSRLASSRMQKAPRF